MRRYRLSLNARRDLREIADFYGGSAGEAVALRMVSKIRAACTMIAETPGAIGRRRAELRPDLRSFPVPPHVIYFRFQGSTVEILRILHGRRDVRSELF